MESVTPLVENKKVKPVFSSFAIVFDRKTSFISAVIQPLVCIVSFISSAKYRGIHIHIVRAVKISLLRASALDGGLTIGAGIQRNVSVW